jgi:uncharacterized membrane protein
MPKCLISGLSYADAELIPVSALRQSLREFYYKQTNIRLDVNGFVGRKELDELRISQLKHLVLSSNKSITDLEQDVIESFSDLDLISEDTESAFVKQRTFGERLADKISDFGGSWTFVISFFVVLLAWIALNTLWMNNKGFDPYPFILLNLVLSCIAAIQAPIIMMSQNRHEQRDRQRAKNDYKVNLKAELEIRMLHEKMDQLIRMMHEHKVINKPE